MLQRFFSFFLKIKHLSILWSKYLLKNVFLNDCKVLLIRAGASPTQPPTQAGGPKNFGLGQKIYNFFKILKEKIGAKARKKLKYNIFCCLLLPCYLSK